MPSRVRPACNLRGQHSISASWTCRHAGRSRHSPAPNYAFKRTAGTGHGVSWCQIGPRPLNAALGAALMARWKPFTVALETQPVVLNGVDLWSKQWIRESGEPELALPHPAYPTQRHTMRVYTLHGSPSIRFAAGELSNGVWGFYVTE
jgi:hypothetical protein